MADRSASAQTSEGRRAETPAIAPRWGFSRGFLTGLVVEIPAIAATVWVLARLGVGDGSAPFIYVARMTTLFAGLAALLTAGGIGRLAAYASVEGGRRRAMFVGARAHAAASAGLVLIAAIPLGDLPERPIGFLAILIAGAVTGVLCGALIGAVCGGAAPVAIADVISLAKRPTEALRHLLSPEEVVKLGRELRTRTHHLFEGIFEPAAKPPAEPPEKKDEKKS
ncbi:MAG TPA: hypothetical protein VGM39_06410 [Kofleriaceae bacterium]|jgi:hypothetical protein